MIDVGHGVFFDTKEKCWQTLDQFPKLPECAGMCQSVSNSCVVANYQLYVARGFVPTERNGIEIPNFVSLDIVNKRWKSLAPMTRRHGRCCLVPLGDHIYAIGGFGGEDEESTKKCEVYSIKEDGWSEIAPMPHPVCRVWPNSAVAYEGKILVFGEEFTDRNYLGNILSFNLMLYDPTSNTWHVFGNYAYSHSSNAAMHQCVSGLVVQDGKCYRAVGGGRSAITVHEVIIDRNDMKSCISEEDQRQRQGTARIPKTLRMVAFCTIGQNMYRLSGGGYHKHDIKIKTYICLANSKCAATFKFDKALLM
ncbi:kelch repeat and BTB domain-containing protein 12-like [Amphiura filiformis]|uniref:kelch repeat and BTB domain-containing protein 12-like n=1 Tax=Amphiura filiformis TaxID=82378 RepID=UPI003B213B28